MSDELIRGWEPLECLVPLDIFKAEVRAWAGRVGASPREVHVRDMSRKWASCSSAGRLTFSRDLLAQPAEFRAEVIAHELLHMKVPNHGTLFRALLKAHLGRSSSSYAAGQAKVMPHG